MTDDNPMLLSNIKQRNARTLINRNILWTTSTLIDILEIFILITFYPRKFDVEKAEHLF